MNQRVAILQCNKIFQSLLKPTLSFVIWWSLFRITLMLVVQEQIVSEAASAFFQTLFTGLRFDFLCWGFMWIPAILLMLIMSVVGKVPLYAARVFNIYFSGFWFLSILIFAFDFLKFSLVGERAVWNDYQNLQFWFQRFTVESGSSVVLAVCFVLFVVFLFQWLIVRRSEIKPVTQAELQEPKAQLFGRLIGPLLLVAFAARGTLAAHHLGKEHSDVSSNAVLNQLVLSPLWTLDK